MAEPHEAERVVRGIYADFARRDVEAALALTDPEGELWPEGTARLAGRTAPYRGHDGIRAYFADVARHWDELVIEPTDLRAVGDAVIVFGVARGRVGDELSEVRVIWVWKLRDGRVLSGRAMPTAAAAMRAAEEDGPSA